MPARRGKAETIALPSGDNHLDQRSLWLLLVGVFLISFSLLAFQITLSRLLSVMLLYHYVFAIVSLALLGIGVGSIFVHFFRPWIPTGYNRFGSLALFASLVALSIPFSAVLMTQIGYLDNVVANTLLHCFLLFPPFFFAGAFLAEVFRMFPEVSARIYGADLVGAAVGSLSVILLLNRLGGISISFLLGVMAGVTALLFTLEVLKRSLRQMLISTTSFLVVSTFLGVNVFGAYLSDLPIVGRNPVKEIHYAVYKSPLVGEIVETRWSAFGRTDLVAYRNSPELMEIYLDGTSVSPMYRSCGNLEHPGALITSLKTKFSGYFPFLFLTEEERNNALIIGPGGGRDVLLALMGGVGQITAVEVNKDMVDIVRQSAAYNGGIYTDFKNVTVVVDEGRNFLKRQMTKYDIITLSLPVTQTSRSLEGYSLTENFLFTTESINDYLEHLTDEGRLVVVTHDDFTTWRLLAITLVALSQRGTGHTAAFNQIYLFGLSTAGTYPVFVLKKTPFVPAEILPRHEKLRQLGYAPALAYFPYITEKGMVNPLLLALANGDLAFSTIEKRGKERGLDFSPVTDNRPFFYKIEVGLPTPVSLVLWSSLFMMVLVVLLPALYWRRALPKGTQPGVKRSFNELLLTPMALFALLGVGFMLVEISLIQKFMLFLGQPVLSMAVLLFSLLVGAGLGSLYSGRLASSRISKGIATASLTIGVLVTVYTFLIPLIFSRLLGVTLAIRLLATVVILIPLGFSLGFPFPLGIRAMKKMKLENLIPWMWGINGAGSVLGSAITIVIALSFGFTQALLAGAVCYFVVFFSFRKHNLRQTQLLGPTGKP